MKKILLVFIYLLLTSCKMKPQPIDPNIKLKINVRIAYDENLRDKLQTRIYVSEALKYLEYELNVRFDVRAEKDFTPNEIVELKCEGNDCKDKIIDDVVTQKWEQCDNMYRPDGAANFCIFNEFIYGNYSNGVLGAQDQASLVVTDLRDRELFINVLRHEIGHLLGAPHSKKLMAPFMEQDAYERIIPFPEEAIDAIRHNILKP